MYPDTDKQGWIMLWAVFGIIIAIPIMATAIIVFKKRKMRSK